MNLEALIEVKLQAILKDRVYYQNVLTEAAQAVRCEGDVDAAMFDGDLLEVGRLVRARFVKSMRRTARDEVLDDLRETRVKLAGAA